VDYDEARKWLSIAIFAGNEDAKTDFQQIFGGAAGRTGLEGIANSLFAAEAGDATAQLIAGLAYGSGTGVVQNRVEAIRWLRKSAEQGNPRGQVELGRCYCEGDGVVQDLSAGYAWFQKAADQGSARGQYEVGTCYFYGWAVPQS